jgi:hypothetical protein
MNAGITSSLSFSRASQSSNAYSDRLLFTGLRISNKIGATLLQLFER